MNVLTSSSISIVPILGVLTASLLVIVLVVAIASSVRRDDGAASGAGPVAFFLFGMSLLTIALGIVSAGVLTYSVTELAGPAPQGLFAATGSSSISCSSSSGFSPPITGSFGNVSNQNGLNIGLCPSGAASSALYGDPNANRDPYISTAVFAGMFLVIAALGFGLAFSRARRLVETVGFGRPGVGRLPLTYAFLMAGLSAISLLAFVPIAGDSIFRAISPTINGTSGHAEGIRSLITFVVLIGLSSAVLVHHLRWGRSLREPEDPEIY